VFFFLDLRFLQRPAMIYAVGNTGNEGRVSGHLLSPKYCRQIINKEKKCVGLLQTLSVGETIPVSCVQPVKRISVGSNTVLEGT